MCECVNWATRDCGNYIRSDSVLVGQTRETSASHTDVVSLVVIVVVVVRRRDGTVGIKTRRLFDCL